MLGVVMSIGQVLMTAQEYQMIKERDEAVPHGVTVCVPYFNEPQDMLERAVQSMLDQTVKPREIILVDDGSEQPHIPEIVAGHDETISSVRVTNRGLPAARNTALMRARGEFFVPLDSDDWVEPTYLEHTLACIGDAQVCIVGLSERGEAPRNREYMPGFDQDPNDVTEKVLWNYNRFFYCALFRTQLLKDIGGYHPAMAGWPGVNGGYEDWDVWIDLRRRGVKIAACREILLNYTTKPESMLLKAERNRAQLVDEMRRHHGCR
jgi:glycosyltransferase involved in cell wall biosynthesis